MENILIGEVKKNRSVNVVGLSNVELTTNQRSFSSEMVETTIDKYELYLNERNSCSNYKMIFSLKPYMSNVLFNPFTEIVYNDGSLNSGILSSKKPIEEEHKRFFSIKALNNVTKNAVLDEDFDFSNGNDRRYQLIRDTEYTHPKIGKNVTYHCGLDIFNNHYLRSGGFNAMQRINNSLINVSNNENNKVFNTIEDYLRDGNGDTVTYEMPNPDMYTNIENMKGGSEITKNESYSTTDVTKTKTVSLHKFSRDNCNTFKDAFKNNISEENGWIGFYNKPYAPIKNVSGEIVNRCINYKDSCSFIDMYPDRTLFSLLPKVNYEYMNREEYNWAWFLTYPYESTTVDSNGNEFDFFSEDGIKIMWNSTSVFMHGNRDRLLGKNAVMREHNVVYFRTKCKHGLAAGETIFLKYNGGECSLRVVGVGNIQNENKEYYFQLSYDDLADEFGEESFEIDNVSIFYLPIPLNMSFRKIVNGVKCEYYVRKFKKLKETPSTINKSAFSRTLYNDNIVHIMFDENINVGDLTDNLGREISEIYLTLLKTNKGYREYYHNGNTHPKDVEYSHCFGRVTSGFNFKCAEDEIENVKPKQNSFFREYNVRSLFNLDNFDDITDEFIENMGINFTPPTAVEEDITVNDDIFYGDFVEFSPTTVEERVIEDVYHRFNTAQRETKLDGTSFPCDFTTFKYDEIVYGDFDFDINQEGSKQVSEIPGFKVDIIQDGFRENKELYKSDDNSSVRDNIFPEGYFYKAHYRVKIKEYSNILSEGYDTKINTEDLVITPTVWGYYEIMLDQSFNWTTDDEIKIVYSDGSYGRYFVHQSSSGNRVVFYGGEKDIESVTSNAKHLYICNKEIPRYAYYINDGVGKYIWRDIVKESEISQDSDIYNRTYANGAIYITPNINFYLRRQDPIGIYGLLYTYENNNMIPDLQINGAYKEKPDVYYNEQDEEMICKI